MRSAISGEYRTRRRELSPKVKEMRERYATLAQHALFRAYPSQPNFGVELCILDAGDALELFWQVLDLGGEAPGGWYQVLDLQVEFLRPADQQLVTVPLSSHVAGFHAWYRMRGGMVSILPCSLYFNLPAGTWDVTVAGTLQDAQPLCLFADAFGDLFHYQEILKRFLAVRDELRAAHFAADVDPAPLLPFRLPAGTLTTTGNYTGRLCQRQLNRLHQVPVYLADVADVPVPPVTPPLATPLDPINVFRKQMYYLHNQSLVYNFCPYDTVNYWDHEPQFERTHYSVSERCAYFHLEALVPLYLATGDQAVYRTARKWYETIRRNIWPAPGGGDITTCADRTQFGSALALGGMTDAICTFAGIDHDPRWVAPFRAGLLAWPMHPTIARPLMDQDAWGNEELNTTGTYNMCTHFALACWRTGWLLNDDALQAKAERILTAYTFPGERDGIWPYRPGDYPSHHYDMYVKWQLARLLLIGAPRWTRDAAFLALLRRAMDGTLRAYAKEEDGVLYFRDWTHNPSHVHPANGARQGAAQLEVMLALVLYADAGYLEPLEKALRGIYRQLAMPEVDRCWHGSWFHLHGNLLTLAQHHLHVEGKTVNELRVIRG